MHFSSKLLTLILVGLFVISVGLSFYKFYVVRDYIVYGHTDCDPNESICFVYECDSASEECTGDPEEDTEYYALIQKNASQIPVCDPHQEECSALTCGPEETECEVTFCDEELAVTEGVECSSPEDFTEEDLDEASVEGNPEGESDEVDTGEDASPSQESETPLTEEPLEVPGENPDIAPLPKDKALE